MVRREELAVNIVIQRLPARPDLNDQAATADYRRALVASLQEQIFELSRRVRERMGVGTNAFAILVVDVRDKAGAELAEHLYEAGAAVRSPLCSVVSCALPIGAMQSWASRVDPDGDLPRVLALDPVTPGAIRVVTLAAGGVACSHLAPEFGFAPKGGVC